MLFDVGPELAQRYGLDPALCAGAQIGKWPWQKAEYRVRSPGPQPPLTLATLRIPTWRNFGNMVYQLLHALAFAEEQGIPAISGPPLSWFRSGTVAGVDLRFGEPFKRPALVGHYFYPQPLGVQVPFRRAHLIRGLRTLFEVDGADRPGERVPGELVVHLRSGDVFSANPHPNYWPPALGYYTAVLADAAPRAVRLVCQDRVHPLLEPLERWGHEHGVPVAVQVSDDLRADLATLTSATTLCISQGTLGLASAWLSASAERVYLPRGAHTEELRALGTTVVEAAVPAPPGAWQASPEQVADLVRDSDPVALHVVA
jgi:hypothetical protein